VKFLYNLTSCLFTNKDLPTRPDNASDWVPLQWQSYLGHFTQTMLVKRQDCLVGCSAVQSCRDWPTFQRCSLHHCSDDGGCFTAEQPRDSLHTPRSQSPKSHLALVRWSSTHRLLTVPPVQHLPEASACRESVSPHCSRARLCSVLFPCFYFTFLISLNTYRPPRFPSSSFCTAFKMITA
jgi:hypothetical protein